MERQLTQHVVTRWYRAPELVLMQEYYNAEIDVWSVGCIMGEMLNRRVLFRGKSYLEQLKLICDLLGRPADDDLSFITNPKGKKYLKSLNSCPVDLHVVFPTVGEGERR